jgi:hypothetical protein
MRILPLLLVIFISCTPKTSGQTYDYPWFKGSYDISNSLANRFNVIKGSDRIAVQPGSFGEWLRYLPLKSEYALVFYYSGNLKPDQNLHAAVIDIDTGTEDLQQCADAIIRLRAEYLWSINKKELISFNFTSGDSYPYYRWRDGFRPSVNNDKVIWQKTNDIDTTYLGFREYLNIVFTYAGTYSLNRELKSVGNIDSLMIGDIFIQGGFPGHAVIVLDISLNTENGHKMFLLGQSFMPAQDIHILKNISQRNLSPWYVINSNDEFTIPEGIVFNKNDLMRFK